MIPRITSILCFCVAICGASTAQADPETHDGFYLQLAGGLGYYHTSAEINSTETTYSGLTIPASFLLGGTLLKHLVIGGGAFVDTAPSPKYEVDGDEPPQTPDFKQLIIGIGALLDYYVWSDRGLHFPVFAGWGGLETVVEGDAWGSDPTGFIMYFGCGYDFWISDNWSIGAVFRFVIAPSKLNDVRYTTVEPGLMATLTFH
jgi:hypothetical protein